MPPADRPFAPIRARRLFLTFFALTILAGMSTGLLSGLLGTDLDDPLLTYFVFLVSFSLTARWAWWYLQGRGLNPQHLLGRLPRGYNWLPVVGLAIALLCFSLGSGLLSYALLYWLAPSWVERSAESLLAVGASESQVPSLYLALEVLSLLVVAPLAEEFLFRGILLHRWAEKWGIAPAILISSFLFGLGHANPIGLTVVGIVWTLLYWHSRTLWVPVAAHFFNNATVYGFSILGSSTAEPETPAELIASLTESWPQGVLLVAVSAPVLGYFIYRRFPRPGATSPYQRNAAK